MFTLHLSLDLLLLWNHQAFYIYPFILNVICAPDSFIVMRFVHNSFVFTLRRVFNFQLQLHNVVLVHVHHFREQYFKMHLHVITLLAYSHVIFSPTPPSHIRPHPLT